LGIITLLNYVTFPGCVLANDSDNAIAVVSRDVGVVDHLRYVEALDRLAREAVKGHRHR
jgi:hypothetical protein